MNSLCEILPSLLVSTLFSTLRNLSSSLPSRTPLWLTSARFHIPCNPASGLGFASHPRRRQEVNFAPGQPEPLPAAPGQWPASQSPEAISLSLLQLLWRDRGARPLCPATWGLLARSERADAPSGHATCLREPQRLSLRRHGPTIPPDRVQSNAVSVSAPRI